MISIDPARDLVLNTHGVRAEGTDPRYSVRSGGED